MKKTEECLILKAIKKLSIEQIQAIVLLLNNEIETRKKNKERKSKKDESNR